MDQIHKTREGVLMRDYIDGGYLNLQNTIEK